MNLMRNDGALQMFFSNFLIYGRQILTSKVDPRTERIKANSYSRTPIT